MQTQTQQFVARINPEMPAGTPRRISLSWLPAGSKNTFDAEDGFVVVPGPIAAALKSVHSDGERTARGGRGPKLFEVVTVPEAQEIVAEEERAKLLSRGGNGVIHADLRAVEVVRRAHERLEARDGLAGPAADLPDGEPEPAAAVAPDAANKAPRAGRKRSPGK